MEPGLVVAVTGTRPVEGTGLARGRRPAAKVDDNFGFSAFGWAVACGDESAGTGLRATGTVGGDGAAGYPWRAFLLGSLGNDASELILDCLDLLATFALSSNIVPDWS